MNRGHILSLDFVLSLIHDLSVCDTKKDDFNCATHKGKGEAKKDESRRQIESPKYRKIISRC